MESHDTTHVPGGVISEATQILCIHIHYKLPREVPILEDCFTEGRLEGLSPTEMVEENRTNQ